MRRLLAPLPLLLLLVGCGPKQPQRQPTAVQVQTIGSAEFNPSIDVISRLSSTTDVSLRPEADGRVVKILVKQGQKVKAGEPILVLDNVQQTAALDSAKAEARKDRLNAERYVFLNEQGAVSTKQRDAYVTQAIQSAERVRSDAATLGYKYVTSPIDGEIGDLDTVKLGDYVRKGQAITGIVDNSTLWTLMDVPATEASRVALNQEVLLRTQGNPPVEGSGKVVFISPYFGVSGNSSSPNTVLVKAAFPNLTGKLKTGQYVLNRIITGSQQSLSVPVSAVLMQAQQPFVYRIVRLSEALPKIKASKTVPEKQKKRLASMPGSTPIVVQTSVQLGDLQHNRYPVRSGLKAGDQVVVSNTALLRTGLPVTIAPASKP
ncbi:MAG: efflux RND transporter periplasmic adaptor subunit [Cyanobacteria bacterium]|uniref:efflux RND transporter periplasmic adaptor subunit n=1 Tax=Synechococcaceae TaxID=1890426 RepID=UPI001FFA6A64|nr:MULTISPECIES: efflux RND transporter periplasmic adaptor subunit [Synechococcaceae]MDA0727741.1 efflux RND transporter periplasmic adaptor subunit [Cyanobacteriota bacterium]NCV92168.1 efflux RND transporter periplasmic adaptor subunit [Synechococcaceae bacterium WB7_3xG_012]MDA0964936.1 efflux RND transporter periplasmic adaptor subunit [Cyanobacteriota bacterium]MDA1156591.1 efflux RND transporter periplasmic adaptor subunit [Cyanobacteriota bacterium]UPH91178.1 efflux RND transporter per